MRPVRIASKSSSRVSSSKRSDAAVRSRASRGPMSSVMSFSSSVASIQSSPVIRSTADWRLRIVSDRWSRARPRFLK